MAKKLELGESLHRTVGGRIRDARRAQQREQAWLAAALGVSRTTMSNIEGGRQRLFLDQIYEVARQLGVAVATLLPRVEEITSGDAVGTPSDDPLLGTSAERLTRVVSDVLTLASARSEGRPRGSTRTARGVQGADSATRSKAGDTADRGDSGRATTRPPASRRSRG